VWFSVSAENVGGGLFGRRVPFQSPTSDPATQPPQVPPFLTGWDSSVGPLYLTPEPSAITLAGLGVGALLLFRRPK
jgi:hypothetical protein